MHTYSNLYLQVRNNTPVLGCAYKVSNGLNIWLCSVVFCSVVFLWASDWISLPDLAEVLTNSGFPLVAIFRMWTNMLGSAVAVQKNCWLLVSAHVICVEGMNQFSENDWPAAVQASCLFLTKLKHSEDNHSQNHKYNVNWDILPADLTHSTLHRLKNMNDTC